MCEGKISLDINDAYRYLGGKGTPDDAECRELEAAAHAVISGVSPRAIQRSFPLRRANGLYISGTTIKLEGKAMEALLHSSHSCILLCVTIGNEIEAMLRKWQVKDIAFAALLDACASAAVENLCEQISKKLDDEYTARGLYLTDRFSPGYGDFPISIQREFCTVLDTARKIGVCVSDSGIMIPRKSISAIIGISEQPQKHMDTGCVDCRLLDGCKFREGGLTCYGQAV